MRCEACVRGIDAHRQSLEKWSASLDPAGSRTPPRPIRSDEGYRPWATHVCWPWLSGPACEAASHEAGTTGATSNAPDDDSVSPTNPAESCTSSCQRCTPRRSGTTAASGMLTSDGGDGKLLKQAIAAAGAAPPAPK